MGADPYTEIRHSDGHLGPPIQSSDLADDAVTPAKIAGAPTATAYTQTFSTADRTHAARTSGATATDAAGLASYGFTEAQANAIVTNLNAVRADLADTAAVVNGLVDDLQALGLVT